MVTWPEPELDPGAEPGDCRPLDEELCELPPAELPELLELPDVPELPELPVLADAPLLAEWLAA